MGGVGGSESLENKDAKVLRPMLQSDGGRGAQRSPDVLWREEDSKCLHIVNPGTVWISDPHRSPSVWISSGGGGGPSSPLPFLLNANHP